MDKQQADHIDLKIQQAADHSHPPFKEEAWQRMEVLLDRELNKKRRRGIIWWSVIMLFMIGGGTALYLYQNKHVETKQENTSLIKPAEPENLSHGQRLQSTDNNKEHVLNNRNIPGKNSALVVPPEILRSNQKIHKDGPGIGKVSGRIEKQQPGVTSNEAGQDLIQDKNHKQALNNIPDADEDEKPAKGEGNIEKAPDANAQPSNQPASSLTSPDPGEAPHPGNLTGKDSLTGGSGKETSRKKTSGFYFNASLASDATAVSGFAVSKPRTVWGLGIGYQLNNRWSLQTGFYAGKKRYNAGAGDYYVKPGSYLSMVDIIKIGADCNIFEIPVSARYNVVRGRRSNVYAVAGLTSVIMQHESYDYHYTSNGAYHQMLSSYNGNAHLFSLINLSAGYEQKIFRSVYLQAEPYIKVPLSGVGEGKVKLYSTGIQFGIRYMPHKK